MNYIKLLPLILLFTSSQALFGQEFKEVDYRGFLLLSNELREYRSKRLIDFTTFKQYAKEKQTIILDTRSKQAYDRIHIKGAIHFNFSDFTAEKLAEVIPDKEVRILIYCNNNFNSPSPFMANKIAPLALNIPTFINLYGYGYENIYELDGYYDEKEYTAEFEYGK